MKFLFSLLLTILSTSLYAQTEIKLEEEKDHVGATIKVKAKIFGVAYLKNAKNTPTFINLGAAYPNQLLTVVIWGDVRKKLDYSPEEKKYAQGMAAVSGKVELYNGKPQIVIKDSSQFKIIYDEEVPASQVPPIDNKKDN